VNVRCLNLDRLLLAGGHVAPQRRSCVCAAEEIDPVDLIVETMETTTNTSFAALVGALRGHCYVGVTCVIPGISWESSSRIFPCRHRTSPAATGIP
jgi:hypothetical protein